MKGHVIVMMTDDVVKKIDVVGFFVS